MKLSKHFTLAELTKSQTAERLGISNEPNDEEIERLKHVCENVLEPVREWYGIPFSPNSGFRCLVVNRALGSKDTSQHLRGEAVDFEIPGVSNLTLAKWLSENVPFDQLILEYYDPDKGPSSGWVHVSCKKYDNRGEVLTISKGRKTVGLPTKGV